MGRLPDRWAGGETEHTMAGRGQTAFIGALLAGMVAATAAVAEAVPLPTPAPLPKTGGVPPPPSAQAGNVIRPPAAVPQPKQTPQPQPKQTQQQQQKQTQQQQPESTGGIPLLGHFFGGSQPQQPQQPNASGNPNLTSTQRALVDKVSSYLSRVQVMSGDFHQIGPDGR